MPEVLIFVLPFSAWLTGPAFWGLCAAIFVAGGWVLARIWRWLSVRLAYRQLDHQFDLLALQEGVFRYQARAFGHSRPDFPDFQPVEVDALPFFRKAVRPDSQTLHRYYVIFGPSGMGKTTLLIRLWRWARRASWRGGLRPQLLRLTDPRFSEKVESIGATERGKTLLLLDGLDELLRRDVDYKVQWDALLDQIQGFARVLITCRTGALPFELESGNREGLLEYIGERHFQVFVRVFLAPLSRESAIRFMKKRLPLWRLQRRKGVRAMIPEMPELLGNPLLLRLALSLKAGKRQFRFTYQLLETYLLSWIADRSPDVQGSEYPRRVWDFLMEISQELAGRRYDSPETSLTLEGLAERAKAKGLDWNKLKIKELLRVGPAGQVYFPHAYLPASLIAYSVFNEGLAPEILHQVPEAVELFREHAWEKYNRACGPEKGAYVRTRAHPEKRPWNALALTELPLITRLYLPLLAGSELRFISYLDGLEAIWMEDPEVSDPEVLLPFLPHPNVRIYRRSAGGLSVFEPLSQPSGRMNAVREIDPEAAHPFRQAVVRKNRPEKEPGSQSLLSLFTWDLTALPDQHCRLRSVDADLQLYECFPGTNELNMFDKAWVCALPGDEVNVLFEYMRKPTLLMDELEEIVQKLVRTYGEDDAHKAGFTESDRSDIEDGCWMGRSWFWGNTDRYAYPVQVFMNRLGEVKLMVFGLPASKVDTLETLD